MPLDFPEIILNILTEIRQSMQKGVLGIVAILVIVCMVSAFLVLRFLPTEFNLFAVFLIAIAVISLLFTILYVRRDSDSITVTTLEDMHSVVREIHKGFLETNPGPRAQTFVGANLIAGNHDYAYDITKSSANEQIYIERYFFISSAFDVNFAVHSAALAAKLSPNPKIKNYYWTDPGSTVLADVFTNVTLFPNKVILTMSSRDDQIHGTPRINKDSDDKNICGLLLTGRQISQFISDSYLHRFASMPTTDLNEAKRIVFNKNSILYLSAVTHAIVKELSALNRFRTTDGVKAKRSRIAYAGLVGSFARALKAEQEGGSMRHPSSFMDIDFLIFIQNLKAEDLDVIKKTVTQVLFRHSIPETLELVYSTDICPECNLSVNNNTKRARLHLIINDYSGDSVTTNSLPPSPLVSYHRIRENIHIFGKCNLEECYHPVDSLSSHMLLNAPLGIADMKNQLTTKNLNVRFWEWNQSECYMKEESRKMNQTELNALAIYAIKWTIVNLVSVFGMNMTVNSWRCVQDHLMEHFSIDKSGTNVDASLRLLESIERSLKMPNNCIQMDHLKKCLQLATDA